MTVLPNYDRLEASGTWRESSDASPRDVIVTFGKTTIVLSDPKTSKVLAHWSLPAIHYRNPAKKPAVFSPLPEGDETLEVDDETMIKAITQVHQVIASRKSQPGRVRGVALAGLVAVVVVAGLIFVPDVIIRHAAKVAPIPTRVELGQKILRDLTQSTGPVCAASASEDAIHALTRRIPGTSQIAVVPDALKGGLRLPGGLTVLGRDTIEGPDTPEVAAGYLIAAATQARARDPLLHFLNWAGVGTSIRLLTTGNLPTKDIKGYGASLLRNPPEPLPPKALLQAFDDAGVSSTPYAFARDPSGESVLRLIEADPFKGAPAPRAVLDDSEWVALQEICMPE